MLKKSLVTLLALIVVIGGIAATKFLQISSMLQAAEGAGAPAESVSSFTTRREVWSSEVKAVGTLEAAQGLTITADIPGRVSKIHFVAGATVKRGEVLLEQETSTERAQLRAAEASVALARGNLERAKDLVAKSLVPRSEFDSRLAEFRGAEAEADNIRTVISKKRIVAPFAGKLGLRRVDVGEDIVEGQSIVTLQSAELMYANFYMPQRMLPHLRPGLAVTVVTDAAPEMTFPGEITVISPEVDAATRRFRVQATLENQDDLLLPGMFASLTVQLENEKSVLMVPQTAVQYATFGDSVYVLTEKEGESGEAAQWLATQQFVRLGDKRGDFVEIEDGLSEGDLVASAGIFKLRNGSAVTIYNETQPDYQLDPQPSNR